MTNLTDFSFKNMSLSLSYKPYLDHSISTRMAMELQLTVEGINTVILHSQNTIMVCLIFVLNSKVLFNYKQGYIKKLPREGIYIW